MPVARDWEDTIRAVVAHALSQKGCRRGWTVLNHRGHARLNIAAGAGRGRRRQVLLPIPRECDQIDQIRDAVVQVYAEFQQAIEPDACVAPMPRSDGSRGAEGEAGSGRSTQTGHPGRPRHRGMAAVLAPSDWEELIAAFREHKMISGEIKPSTWHRVYRHPMNQVLGAVVVWPWVAGRERLLPGVGKGEPLTANGVALSDSDSMEELRLHPVHSFLFQQRSGLYSAAPRR
jgi:hypothetical protein